MAKRAIINGEESGMKKQKWEAGGMDRQETRALIDNNEASIIIGKGGSNVKQLRADSNSFVSILRNDTGSNERVLQVRGSVDANSIAFQLIAELLLKNDAERNKTEVSECKPWVFKLLIHKQSAGAIIGKGGEIIRSMQAETNARVSISTEPIGGSTEKTVTVTGQPAQLHDVIKRILTRICENPIKPGTESIPYVPGQAPPTSFGGPPGPYGGNPYGMSPGPYGMPPGPGGPGGFGAPPPMGGGSKTQKIVIPTVCAGTVIGKGGSIIRDIKAVSGTNISVAAPDPNNSEDRVVTITGSEQGIQTAIFQIRQRVESYQAPSY